MSGLKDAAKAAAVTASVVHNMVTGQGPSVGQAMQVAQGQQLDAVAAQIAQATNAAGQPTSSGR